MPLISALYYSTLRDDCSKCDSNNNAEWYCPVAKQVYNQLVGNSPDNPAMIIELEGGGGELECMPRRLSGAKIRGLMIS